MTVTFHPDGRIVHNGVNRTPSLMVDRWRLTGSVTGAQDPLSSNLTRSNQTGAGKIGTGMSVSSGIWTFPSTGIYKVEAHWSLQNASSAVTWADMDIRFAQDGTTYNAMARAVDSVSSSGYYTQTVTTLIVDVTDASVSKLKFKVNYSHGSTQIRGSGSDYTWFDFIRLGDT